MKLYTKEEIDRMKAGTYQKKRQFPLSEVGEVIGGKFIEVVEREGTDFDRKYLRLETKLGIREVYVNASLEQELDLKEPEVSQYLEIAFVGTYDNPRGGNPLRIYEVRMEEAEEEGKEETIEKTEEAKGKAEETDKSEKKNSELNDEQLVTDILNRLKAIPEDLRDKSIIDDTIGIHCTLNRLTEMDTERIRDKVLKAFPAKT